MWQVRACGSSWIRAAHMYKTDLGVLFERDGTGIGDIVADGRKEDYIRYTKFIHFFSAI